ncbi:MAG: CRISPR-associated protein Cmr2 [Synechococcales cyanobacterium C42_A2020_086]|nr:CRISPR-associated protein Cmr2 [Synechococcales cyanobacterium C42_A2020_086]
MTDSRCYTAISFAPVQGFIEKSRKLRDLYGASLILSYLSFKLVKEVEQRLGEGSVISPGLVHVLEGMPHRILVRGHLTREIVRNTLLKEWQKILKVCRKWIEDNIGIPKEQYCWAQTEGQTGKEKGEWERWGEYTWEVFWGSGDSPRAAMEDLETRKLKRDWTAINWLGESSSLSGTDAIAWHRLGEKRDLNQDLTPEEKLQLKEEQELFYRRLSWLLDDPDKHVSSNSHPSLDELKDYEKKNKDNPHGIGRYIAVNERLSIPELVKRLVTLPRLAKHIGMTELEEGFKDIAREQGYWTGWFIGDGDQVGDKLITLAEQNPDDPERRDASLNRFTELMRDWGSKFKENQDLFPAGKGRVIYAGGDDFLGVLYSEETQTQEKPEKLKPIEAWNWLMKLPEQWKDLQAEVKRELDIDFTYSVGFVWAAHSVPQRDVLQHCREAEKRSKNLGRDRVTIRVVFNSGQYVQWTCPWNYLDILTKYRDRNGVNTQEEIEKGTKKTANWNHLYSDWATLKARHAVQLKEIEEVTINKEIAVTIFNLYFDDAGKQFEAARLWDKLTEDNTAVAIVNWIDDLIQVGWQLCRNSEP